MNAITIIIKTNITTNILMMIDLWGIFLLAMNTTTSILFSKNVVAKEKRLVFYNKITKIGHIHTVFDAILGADDKVYEE